LNNALVDGEPQNKEKILFNFCVGGSSYRHIRKGEARELYAEVLLKLKDQYPNWAANFEESQ
jgi:hypothetical protein